MKLNFVHVVFWHLSYQNGHTNDYLRTPKCYNSLVWIADCHLSANTNSQTS